MRTIIDDDAVSPVIGVILMVAITVVLAAVVFVLVSDAGNESEAARFPIIEVREGSAPAPGIDTGLFTAEHRAGQCLNMNEYTFKARHQGTVYSLVTSGYSGPVCVGDTFTIDEVTDSFQAADAGSFITLFALDGTSDSLVYEADVRLAA